jgi:hypothetical protein
MGGAYKFLRVIDDYRGAECLDHATGNTTTFYHGLFEGLLEGTNFTFNNKSWPKTIISVITEEEIPVIIKKDQEAVEAYRFECERIKADNIATGRFTYSYSNFRNGQSETIAETIVEDLTDNFDDFWQVALERSNQFCSDNINLEDFKKSEYIKKFMGQAQSGDKLQWYSWNGGPLAYSAGFQLSRGGTTVAYLTFVVS